MPRFPDFFSRGERRSLTKARCEAGVATMKCGFLRPQAEPATAGHRLSGALAEGQPPKAAIRPVSERSPYPTTIGVLPLTRLKRSMTSWLIMRTQPDDIAWPMVHHSGEPCTRKPVSRPSLKM